jgi:RNA polymerase-binding transcription factor DksA
VTALDEATLQRLRTDLEHQRENLRREIVDQGADPDSDEVEIDVERGFADSAHSTAERSRVISVVRALRANLRWVNRALGKLEHGG